MNEKNNAKPPKKRPEVNILRFTGIALTMASAIGLFIYGGRKIDQSLENKTPWFTIGGAMIGLTAGFYLAIKDLTRS